MADFVKKDWKCGDTITADELNRMEDGIEEALSSGWGSVGYECKEEYATLTDESVTTVMREGDSVAYERLSYPSKIDADTIKVTFDGVEYICENRYGVYGALYNEETDSTDWSAYPFTIYWGEDGNYLNTENAGTHQVKIESYEKTVETSECFDRARGYSCSGGTMTTLVDEMVTFVLP